MANTTELQNHLAAIEKAIASGVLEMTYDGVTTKYRSLHEMRAIRDDLRSELGMTKPETAAYVPTYYSDYQF